LTVEDSFREISIYDEECRERALRVLQKYPPGNYLFKSPDPERLVEQYFKMDKRQWLSFFAHDYAVACLRKDTNAEPKIREAYARLASALDWEEREPRFSGDIRALAEEAVKRLMELYEAELRVEGWRRKPEECLIERRDELLGEIGFFGDQYRLEYGSWMWLAEEAFNFSAKMRLRDRVAYWMGLRLVEEASQRIYGEKDSISFADYPSNVLENIISGEPVDEDEDASMWFICVVAKEIKAHAALITRAPGSIETEDPVTFSCMALEGEKPSLEKVEQYLNDLSLRLNLRAMSGRWVPKNLFRLYYRARHGPPEKGDALWSGFLKPLEEMSEEEAEAFKQWTRDSLLYLRVMLPIIQFLRAKYGYKRSELLDRLRREVEKLAKVAGVQF